MAKPEMSPNFGGYSWSFLWLFFGSVFAPVLVPWLIYRVVNRKKSVDSLRGKVVLITGASSGLGEALAHTFYKIGCKVILAARRVDELERVKADLIATRPVVETSPPEVLRLDLAEIESIPKFAESALGIYGCVDILINNGGISYRGNIESTGIDVDIKLMTVNYFGQVCLTKAILPSMIKRKSGHIVAMSSVQGKISIPFRSAYAASKHALQAFFDCLSSECRQHNVGVTVASPGYVKTNISVNAVTASGDQYGVLDATTASGLPPQEVAERILSAILSGKKDLVVSPLSPRLAILIRALCPPLYFLIMERRALKEQ